MIATTNLPDPEAGDSIQTMKAGLFEIADIFAVNKADRPGADILMVELQMMLNLHAKQNWWQPPVISAQALNNVGMEELYEAILKHRQALEETGRLSQRRLEQRRREFMETVESRVAAEIMKLEKHIILPKDTKAFICADCGAVSLDPNQICKVQGQGPEIELQILQDASSHGIRGSVCGDIEGIHQENPGLRSGGLRPLQDVALGYNADGTTVICHHYGAYVELVHLRQLSLLNPHL
jgi:rubrerythrin